MSTSHPSRDVLQAACDAVVEYAILSLEPRFHLWEPTVNLGVAEVVWNSHLVSRRASRSSAAPEASSRETFSDAVLDLSSASSDILPCPPASLEGALQEPAFRDLVQAMQDARRAHWPKEDFHVLGLRVRHTPPDVLFSFELTWDEGITFHPCEIAWDPRSAVHGLGGGGPLESSLN